MNEEELKLGNSHGSMVIAISPTEVGTLESTLPPNPLDSNQSCTNALEYDQLYNYVNVVLNVHRNHKAY